MNGGITTNGSRMTTLDWMDCDRTISEIQPRGSPWRWQQTRQRKKKDPGRAAIRRSDERNVMLKALVAN